MGNICGKGPGCGRSGSPPPRRTSRRWNPNVQTVHAVARPGGNKQRLNVCTSCIKAGKVVRG
ncbi:50S ribosomal protein L28 [Mycobacterium avium]|uniref:50S ribosomal protein L28 n=1 Tax=Mycobacterium avium TaxID=1764 RepID=UPI0007A0422F|nr:50S ribosomal protein L28 [Mycobacterium avium]